MAEAGVAVPSTNCVVCVEEIDGVKRLHAVGPCNHPGVCSLCYLRLRQLMKKDTCVLCKTVMDRVMVCQKDSIRPFEEYQVWGDNAGPEYDWDDKARMFLPKVYNRSFVIPLQECVCKVENCPRPKSNSVGGLEKHLREQHRLSFCKTCLKHRKVFLMEHQRYTNIELQQHIVKGDPKLGQAGHPRCEFCKERYYDAAHLHEHLVKDHYSCHLCEKQGILHKYYRDYTDLERHFRTGHYLCEEEECLEKKFIVFADEIDLTAHTLQMHPHKPAPRKIQVNFKIKRSNWDGTGDEKERDEEKKEDEMHEWTYEGEIGAQTDPPEVLAARREAVRQAARAAGMVGLPPPPPRPTEEEAFPSLLSNRTARQTTGWANIATAGNRPRAEDFPALHTPAGSRTGAGRGGGSNFRAAVEAYPTLAQEIAMSGPGEGGWCFEVPMPPSPERPKGGGKGGAGGPRRVAGIGNMKLRVDKKAGKRKQKGGGSGSGGGGGGGGGAGKVDESFLVKQVETEVSTTVPLVTQSAVTPAEEFPLAPGMSAPPASSRAMPIVASGPTLAESIAAQQHRAAPPPAGAGAGGGAPSVVGELRDLLGDEGFAEVKDLSASYRSGWMMPGEYFKAMQDRLPTQRFGELFEGLVGILPDEDKKREMLVLLSASRAAEAKQAESKKSSMKNKTASSRSPTNSTPNASTTNRKTLAAEKSTDGAGTVNRTATANGITPNGTISSGGSLNTSRSSSPDNWPGIGADQRDSKQNGSSTMVGGKAKNNASAGKKNANNNSSPSPGSGATWLKAMNRAGSATGGKTGISVVRSRGGNASSKAGNSASSGPNLGRATSESPPPGFVMRRKGDGDEDYVAGGIGDAGASWATQGGAGFRGASKGTAKGVPKVSRDDFPGLPGAGAGGGAGTARAAPPPREDPNGFRVEGRQNDVFARGSIASKAPVPVAQRAPTASSQEDFPGLPMPAQARPGMERISWGAPGGNGSQKGGGGVGTSSGGGGLENGGGGKGAKKKNKQKAEKGALKGMAFGFR